MLAHLKDGSCFRLVLFKVALIDETLIILIARVPRFQYFVQKGVVVRNDALTASSLSWLGRRLRFTCGSVCAPHVFGKVETVTELVDYHVSGRLVWFKQQLSSDTDTVISFGKHWFCRVEVDLVELS